MDAPAADPLRPVWEYEYVQKPQTFGEFEAILADKGKQGWEHSGESVTDGTGSVRAPAGVTVLVFKRATPRDQRVGAVDAAVEGLKPIKAEIGAPVPPAQGEVDAAVEGRVIVADEKAVLFKVKDVTLDSVDEAKRTIAASFGRADAPVKLTGLPLAKDIGIRVSLVKPGSVNNVPFDMARLKGLVGKQVSALLRAEASGLAVASIAVAND